MRLVVAPITTEDSPSRSVTPITEEELRVLQEAAAGSLLVLDHERERVLDELDRRRAELLEVPEVKER